MTKTGARTHLGPVLGIFQMYPAIFFDRKLDFGAIILALGLPRARCGASWTAPLRSRLSVLHSAEVAYDNSIPGNDRIWRFRHWFNPPADLPQHAHHARGC